MTHFPHMMALVLEKNLEKTMFDFEDINAILNAMADANIVEPVVEPIDDPSIQTDFYDWADVVGVLDEIEPGINWA